MKHHLYLLFLFLFLFVNKVVGVDANTDKQSLLSFKLAISDPQHLLSGWNSTTASSHCTWLGVTCTNTTSNADTRVNSLRLSGLDLSGTISPHLSNLTRLQILDLSNNSFRGQIPSEFSRLSFLTHLILSQNFISGTIPYGISKCYNLREISLSFNKLTGHLPPQLGLLSRLRKLDCTRNSLTGVIPPTFGNLSYLSFLSLARNQLQGTIPSELGYINNLSVIYLSENRFNGEIPPSIFKNLSSLVFLSLSQNNFSGNLPTDIGIGIPNIEVLYLGRNSLVGEIPDSLSNASRIQFLDLSSNHFQGSIPLFGKMTRLILLDLGGNNLSSTTELNSRFFESLSSCTELRSIIVYSNRLAGELPESIANLTTKIEHFCIDSNLFTGIFPPGIGNFQSLISLAIQSNFFTGQIPLSIGSLAKLQKMTLGENNFSGEIPDVFGNLTRLFHLTMGRNQFSGKIPPSIGKCQHLSTLDLGYNSLVGSIPKEIFGLYSLNKLYLANNSLNDSLPIEIGSLKQVELMYFSGNSLSGSLPETIGGCLSTRYLRVARNNFTGPIPKSMGKLVALETLDLSSNNFSGPIPVEFEKFPVLKELNLSFNNLEGAIPRNGELGKLGWNSFQGNSKLCGNDQETAGKLRVPNCSSPKKESNPLKFILLVVIPIAIVSAVSCLAWALISRKRKRQIHGGEIEFPSSPSLKGLPPKISYFDIQTATNGFAAENLVGKGSFGSVYRGQFGSDETGVSTALAVKVINLDQSKALKSFNAECQALRNARHRNLVRVITSCSSIDHRGEEFKALVMDFMSNGNLGDWLHPKGGEFQWDLNLGLTQRLGIAIDVASAMDYLHHDCEPPIVHCDLKPTNVLLNDDMGAHVGDFGLARFLHPNSSENQSSTVGLKGSIGYIAPEYGLGSNVSARGDVYSFGILLLEIFTSKKPTDEMFNNSLNLTNFVSAALQQNQVMKIADVRILETNNESSNGNYTDATSSFNGGGVDSSSDVSTVNIWGMKIVRCLDTVMRVGLGCAADSAGDRPTMRETLTKLQEIKRILLG